MIDFYKYIQPIVNGCSGFIKTSGYVTHIPGAILLMSFDYTYFTIIKIPVIFNYKFTAQIRKFLQLKDEESQSKLLDNIYFMGWNIIQDDMIRYYQLYNNLSFNNKCIYEEPDCFNIANFAEAVSTSDISSISISTKDFRCLIPASKAITQINKADSCSLQVYDSIYGNNVKTVKWLLKKNKFKLIAEIYSNILIV